MMLLWGVADHATGFTHAIPVLGNIISVVNSIVDVIKQCWYSSGGFVGMIIALFVSAIFAYFSMFLAPLVLYWGS